MVQGLWFGNPDWTRSPLLFSRVSHPERSAGTTCALHGDCILHGDAGGARCLPVPRISTWGREVALRFFLYGCGFWEVTTGSLEAALSVRPRLVTAVLSEPMLARTAETVPPGVR